MSPDANSSSAVFTVCYGGFVQDSLAYSPYRGYPVVHLKSTIKIASGTGSSTAPFILSGN